ncbi:MAG: flagellar biosynthesis protein [Thermotogaceae bacterium]|nr:flagellar biosynthesis protein [Thermotogaceae bacterium]
MDSLNDIPKAVALRYDRELEEAPRIIAQGKGEIAKKIIEIALENNIPIHEDPVLADILLDLEYYSEIPEELYRIVAKVLILVYEIENEFSKKVV